MVFPWKTVQCLGKRYTVGGGELRMISRPGGVYGGGGGPGPPIWS